MNLSVLLSIQGNQDEMLSASPKLDGYFNIQPVYFGEETAVHKAIYIQQVHCGSD